MTTLTPVGAVARGLVAGAAGTLAMDLLLFTRYKRAGGKSGFRDWELSTDVENWEQAPAPAQVGRRLFEGLFQRSLPDRRAALVNNLVHWGFGVLGAVPFGILAGSLRSPRASLGLPFGVCVWAGGYAVLPAAKLYQPIWTYDAKTLAADLSAHCVYGLTTGVAFTLLSQRKVQS